MTKVIDKPSFESVYLLTQRNAEAIQKLGEKLEAMAVREEERRIAEAEAAAKREAEVAKRQAEAAKREEKRRIAEAEAAAKREEERRIEEAKRDQKDRELRTEFRAELKANFRESRRRINKLDELFNSQWGKLVEALVDGRVVNILNKIGIKVEQTTQRSEGFYEGKKQEIDILAINGDEIVAIEVKTTLRPEDIRVFEDKLKVLKLWMRQYAGEKIYGAVAYIRADAGSAELAAKRGLFVIKAVGASAYLTNAEGFKPRTF